MKNFSKTTVIVVSLLLSAGLGFAAEVKNPATDLKGTVTSVKEGEKNDAKASVAAVKLDTKSKTADVKTAAKARIIDINSATEAELKSVPGIGDAFAAKIIAGRPYANKAQLKSRKILPTNIYEQVKAAVIAKSIKK